MRVGMRRPPLARLRRAGSVCHGPALDAEPFLAVPPVPLTMPGMDGLTEVAPGKFFAAVRRPPGSENFPFRVVFTQLDVCDARRTHLVCAHQHNDYEVIVVDGC